MSDKKLQLSIIIPVYNTEKYLEDCIDSILRQGIDSYEIIIINDGSTDKSKDIIKNYLLKYPFIKYHEQENAGQGSARNVGIDMARGEYTYFMDSDDVLADGKLKEMLEKIICEKLDAIFFDGKSFMDEQLENNITDSGYTRRRNYGYYSHGEDLLSDFSTNNELVISPCLYITKTRIIKKNNLYFPIDYKHEDEYFTATLFLFLGRCCHVKDIVFLRRIRENSTMTNTNKIPSFKGYVHVLKYFDNFFETFDFKTVNGKRAYKKKISQVTKSAYQSYSQIKDKKRIEQEFNSLMTFTKKYNFFNFTTFLFIQISKNSSLLSIYSKIAQALKKIR